MGACGSIHDGAPLCARRNAALPALLLGRTAIGERVWDVMRSLDAVERHFSDRVDLTNILCTGNSGGGTTAFYAACIDDRIRVVMPSCAVPKGIASIPSLRGRPRTRSSQGLFERLCHSKCLIFCKFGVSVCEYPSPNGRGGTRQRDGEGSFVRQIFICPIFLSKYQLFDVTEPFEKSSIEKM